MKYTTKTGYGGLAVSLLIALDKVIKKRALVPRGYKQQRLWCQEHKL